MDIGSKKALVTGGAVRIGRVICEQLAAAGCEVAIQYRNSRAEAYDLVKTISASGVRACAIHADLRNAQETDAIIPQMVAQLGGADILINNASVFHKHDLLSSTPDVLQAEIRVNALAPIALMRAFAKQHRDSQASGWPQARIINILDRRIAGTERGALPYNLSKHMLHDATRIAALELGPAISVNAVAPGPILPPPGEAQDYLSERAGPMVLGRRPQPADIARTVLFLLQAEGLTGQVIFVDSGQHLL